MIQECEFKDFLDIFYQGINKQRKEYALEIISEDQQVSIQILDQVLKGNQKEQEDRRLIYNKCEMYCGEEDIIFSKQEMQMNSYSTNRQEVEEAIRYLFNQIYLDNQKEIQYNKKLTHMKIHLIKTHTDILRSCFLLSAKPLQIVEFSYDTLIDSYVIQGRLNRYISQEPINLYALKIIDQYNMKDIVVGPGRGQIDEKLNFKFKIPYQLLKDCGIQPQNSKCEIEFFHKIEADISHYNHFGFNFVDIDHTYSLIMKQSFLPVQNGRASAKKSRRDSPDVRKSNSLFKNRLSSSCNKENRIPNSNDKRLMSSAQYNQNSAGDSFFSQQVNQNQPYNYYSEKRNKGQHMDSIWEANEKEFSIYKDDNFRSEHRRQNHTSSSKQKQIFSFGEQDQSFFADSGNTNRQFGPNQNFIENKDAFFTDRQPIKQIIVEKQTQNLFQNPQNNIFKQSQYTQNPIIIKTSQNLNNQQSQSVFNGTTKPSHLFSNSADNSVSAGSIFGTTSDKNLFSKSNQTKDIWNTSKKDLFQYEGKPDNKSLQNPPLLSTNLFQLNNDNNQTIINTNNSIKNTNNSMGSFSQMNQSHANSNNQQTQIFSNIQSINAPSEPLNIFQNSVNNFSNNSTQPIIPQLPIAFNNNNHNNNNIIQNPIQNIIQNPIQNLVQNSTQNLVQNGINQAIPLLDNQSLEKSNLQQQINNINSQTTLLNGSFSNNSLGMNNNPFSQSEKFYFKGVKHTFTQYENLAKIPINSESKLPSNRLRVQKILLDSRNFKDPNKKAQKLKEIEKIYKCCKEPLKSDYQKYWNTGEHCDFTLSLENDQDAYYKLHKVVVSHYSEYFRKLFNDQKFSHFTLKQNNFNNEAVRLMFKWMYFNELPTHEWDEMSFKQAQQTLNCALYTKTWEFLVQVIIKVIIPKMTSEKLIDFLILSEYLPSYFANRKEDESLNLLFGVLKLLQNYCILYFSNNSIEVIEKTEDLKIQQLVELNSDLIFTLVNETCLKFDTLDHLERLFIWLSKQAPVYFGRNIVELCSFFESQYLNIQQFDKIYMPFEKEIKSLKSNLAYTTPYFDKTPNLMKETPTKSAQKSQNDGMFDEDDVLFTEIENILLSKKEWPSSNLIKQSLKDEYCKQRDAIFNRACDFTFQFKRPDIPTVFISEEFYSYSRKWRLVLIVDGGEDQNISVFIRESGQRSQQELDVNLYSERILFSSALIRVEFQDRKSCCFDMFYSFANNQNMTVGRNKFCQAKRIADAQNHNIKINVWIEELKCHSGLMHYISQKLVQLIGNGFNEEQKKMAETEIEQSNKKRMINNEPVSNRRQSDRIMEALLDKEWDKITAQMDEEGKILSPIKSRMSVNRIAKDNFQQKTKELNIFSLPVFEAYYILTSDNLNINHEKYAIHLIYRVCLNKSDIEIDLLLHGVRFSYLDLDQMLNLARDHNAIKRNKYFQSMIRKELNQRFEMYQEKVVPLQKGRNHYDYAQFYKNQNRKDFKQNFLDWLFNQEHHPGFKSEIQKIQNAIKSQMEELRQKEFEINQQFMKLKQEQANMKVKNMYCNSGNQKMPFSSSASTIPSNNSQNGSIQSNTSSFDDNRRNIVQAPPHYSQTEPRVIYNQNGQPLLNLSNQERQRIKSTIDFNSNNLPYISSSKSIDKDNCTIF